MSWVVVRLAFQTALAVGTGAFLVLAIDLSFTVHRERGVIELEMREGHERMLTFSEAQVGIIIAQDGFEAARARVAGFSSGQIQFSLSRVDEAPAASEHVLTTTRLLSDASGAPVGRLVVAELTAREESFLQDSIWQRLLTLLVMALVVTAITWGFSTAVVTRRVDRLVSYLRDVGTNRVRGPLHLGGGDELATLADEANAMSLHLNATRAELEVAHTARITALEQLRHADRLSTMGRLSAGLAHELGTPLSVISIKADRIKEAVATDVVRAHASIIRERVEFIRVLVRRMLQFARPSSGDPAARATSQVELLALSKGVVAMLAPLSANAGVEVAFEASASPVVVTGDSQQLEQVLSNLLTNALLASSKGHVVTVSVRFEQRKNGPHADLVSAAVLEVRDQGVGMSPDVLAHLFEPFFTTRPVGSGTGLGLSVCWGLVREHGGWIEVASTPGSGSTFTVVIPHVQPQEVPDAAPTPDAPRLSDAKGR